MNANPIGIFDSGFGGLTVASQLAKQLPYEGVYYVGDTQRCPYGTRPQSQVADFVKEVGAWLSQRQAKMIIIACNTATAAGLEALQKAVDTPCIGVIQPGAEGGVDATRNGRIGVVATEGTVNSGSYVRAIHRINLDVQVFQTPAPRFVQIVESTLMNQDQPIKTRDDLFQLFDTPEVRKVVAEELAPLKEAQVDTLILGCTHFPLLRRLIQKEMGPDCVLVDPAENAVAQARQILTDLDQLAPEDGLDGIDGAPVYRFATTASDILPFGRAAQVIFGHPMDSLEHIQTKDLEMLLD